MNLCVDCQRELDGADGEYLCPRHLRKRIPEKRSWFEKGFDWLQDIWNDTDSQFPNREGYGVLDALVGIGFLALLFLVMVWL